MNTLIRTIAQIKEIKLNLILLRIDNYDNYQSQMPLV